MNNKELFAGIDIGGTKVAIGLFDENALMLYRARKATLKAKSAQELRKFLLNFLCETVSEADKKGCVGGGKLKGIGIGVPAPVNQRTGKILFTPNIPKLTELNLLEDFKNYFRVRTAVDNDANCAALAEHRYGAGRGTDNMAYVTISTGIGGGLILNGKLFRGTNGFAGEVGHVIMDMHSDAVCGCGNKGCAEALASGANLEKLVKTQIKNGKHTIIKKFPVTGEILKEAYMKGDTLAREIFFQITEIVGTLLYNISTILDIDRFVIGGGFINFGDDLFVGIKNAFMKYSKIPADIVCAELKQDFGIIGAAQLLFE